MSISRVKAMVIVVLDAKGVVHHKFVSDGQTVNGAFYLEVLRRLKKRVKRAKPSITGN